MERFKFETLITEDTQIKKLEECLANTPHVVDWQIDKLIDGIILSINAIKITAFDIVIMLKEQGFSAERLYEE